MSEKPLVSEILARPEFCSFKRFPSMALAVKIKQLVCEILDQPEDFLPRFKTTLALTVTISEFSSKYENENEKSKKGGSAFTSLKKGDLC